MPKAPDPRDKRIGQNVRRIRMLRSMSQEKLGDALKLTFQQVQKYEKGTNRISGSRLQQISEALNCSVSNLFEGVATNGSAPLLNDPCVELGGSSVGVRMARAFVKLPLRLQHTIADLCEQKLVSGKEAAPAAD